MTLREFYHECVAAKERIDAERKQAMTMAWLTAAFSRIDKLPTLSAVLGSERKQTPDQQKAVIASLSAKLGVPLRRVRLIRRDDGRQ